MERHGLLALMQGVLAIFVVSALFIGLFSGVSTILNWIF